MSVRSRAIILQVALASPSNYRTGAGCSSPTWPIAISARARNVPAVTDRRSRMSGPHAANNARAHGSRAVVRL